jgi:hypothetical protein
MPGVLRIQAPLVSRKGIPPPAATIARTSSLRVHYCARWSGGAEADPEPPRSAPGETQPPAPCSGEKGSQREGGGGEGR